MTKCILINGQNVAEIGRTIIFFSTSLNINNQSTKSFSYYTRSIINMHK